LSIRFLIEMDGKRHIPHAVAVPALDRLRRGAATLVGVGLVLAFSGCASAGPFNPDRLPVAQVSEIGDICHSVMGLPVSDSDAEYLACEQSLSHSARAVDEARGLQAARDACLAKGLKPGEVALSECELTSSKGQSPIGHPAEIVTKTKLNLPPTAAPAPIKSYFRASSGEVFRREQMACARIGYDPITAAFHDCVASLQAAMFEAEHPQN
jgi:hypothetical protein